MMLWENLRGSEFEEAVKKAKGVCVVPIGCLERHGPHSPLGTDTIIAERICEDAAKLEPVVIFPTMYFGEKSGAQEYPGTVIFSVETRWAIFQETCNEIYRNGFKKILFVNGHGGNSSMLGLFIRGMLEKNPNVLIYSTTSGGPTTKSKIAFPEMIANKEKYPYLTDEDRAGLQEFLDQGKGGGHAGIYETAIAMHYVPDTVRMDLAATESGYSTHLFDSFAEAGISSPLAWMADHPNSYEATNDYYLSPNIARAITETRIELLAQRFKFIKEETVSTDYHAQWIKKQK